MTSLVHHFQKKHNEHLKAPIRKEMADMIQKLSPPAKLRLPKRTIDPVSWLPAPRKGAECKICQFISASKDGVRQHIKRVHKSHITPQTPVKDLIQEDGCYYQRLYPSGDGSQAFRVNPIFSTSPGSHFHAFMENLDKKWTSGEFLKEAAQAAGASEEYDITGFLAAAGWIKAVEGYSWQELQRKVALPLKDQELHLFRIKGFGQKFLSQLQNLNDVDPLILQELTSWRKSQ
jgi:hypothetical protein